MLKKNLSDPERKPDVACQVRLGHSQTEMSILHPDCWQQSAWGRNGDFLFIFFRGVARWPWHPPGLAFARRSHTIWSAAWNRGAGILQNASATKFDMTYQQEIALSTQGSGDMHDLTGKIAEVVMSSKIQRGIVNVFNIGSTAAVGTIEFEPGLRRDLPGILSKLIPPSRSYGHEQTWHDGNGHSHLQATLLGPSLTVPVAEGKLVLGTWQQIFHLECDVRSRQRAIIVTVIGE